MIDRRSLLTGLVCAIAAPAIVRASSLMPVKSFLGIDLAPYPDATVMLRIRPLSPGFKVGDIISAERMSDAELQAVFGIPRSLLLPALPDKATYLVLLADKTPDHEEFLKVLEAIENV